MQPAANSDVTGDCKFMGMQIPDKLPLPSSPDSEMADMSARCLL